MYCYWVELVAILLERTINLNYTNSITNTIMKRKYTLKAMLCMSLILIFYNPLFLNNFFGKKSSRKAFKLDMRGVKTDLNDEIKKFIYSTTQMDVIIYVVNQGV